MTQWEYVKGSEADFEGVPDTAQIIIIDKDTIKYHAERRDLDVEQKITAYDIGSHRGEMSLNFWTCQKGSINEYFLYSSGEHAYTIIAERRKVDNLQSRVNDANLGDALKEMFKEGTHGASKDQFAHLNDLPLVSEKYDTVQRPAHYNQSGIECIDAIAASMTPVEFQAYLKGNVQKYLWRYQHKNGVEDCRKAQWYLDRLIKELSK